MSKIKITKKNVGNTVKLRNGLKGTVTSFHRWIYEGEKSEQPVCVRLKDVNGWVFHTEKGENIKGKTSDFDIIEILED